LGPAVFAAAQGQLLDPLQTPFGWHVIRVTEVKPETTRPFEDARADIERDLRLHKANDQLPALSTKLDDEIAAGTPLEQAAERLGLKVVKGEGVDRQGRDAKGQAEAVPGLGPEMLTGIFAGGKGDPSLMNQTKDGRYYMYRVDDIQPAHQRPLEEVRAEVVEAWKRDQRAEKAKARAEELRVKAPDAAALAALAAEQPQDGAVSLRDVGPLKRDDQGYAAGLMPDAVKAMFETPAGAVASRVVPVLDGSAVLAVDEVTTPPAEQALVDKKRDALTDDMRGDILAAYEAALRQRYPVSVDDRQLAQLMQSQAQ
jgi:peptidyl-prolyl cis-trans isomerase D